MVGVDLRDGRGSLSNDPVDILQSWRRSAIVKLPLEKRLGYEAGIGHVCVLEPVEERKLEPAPHLPVPGVLRIDDVPVRVPLGNLKWPRTHGLLAALLLV